MISRTDLAIEALAAAAAAATTALVIDRVGLERRTADALARRSHEGRKATSRLRPADLAPKLIQFLVARALFRAAFSASRRIIRAAV